MAEADTILAEYSRLAGRIACMEHSLRDVGQRLAKLAQGLGESPVAVTALDYQSFQLDSTDRLNVKDLRTAWEHLRDLAAARKRADELARTLARTEHGHMVRRDR